MGAAIPAFVHDDLAKLGIAVDAPRLAQLAMYLDLMLEANQQFNLTSIRDRDDAWRRHIIDSLTILPGLEPLLAGAAVIDVGSGGGLPGVPVAIVRPDLHVTLLEATGKKARFLTSCVERMPLANVTVVNNRAEVVGRDAGYRERFDAVVCRAVGPLRVLLEYTLPLAAVGGLVLAMKGPSVEAELDEAGDAMAKLGAGDVQVFDAYPEGFDIATVVVSIVKDRRTPRAYPRAPGMAKQQPL